MAQLRNLVIPLVCCFLLMGAGAAHLSTLEGPTPGYVVITGMGDSATPPTAAWAQICPREAVLPDAVPTSATSATVCVPANPAAFPFVTAVTPDENWREQVAAQVSTAPTGAVRGYLSASAFVVAADPPVLVYATQEVTVDQRGGRLAAAQVLHLDRPDYGWWGNYGAACTYAFAADRVVVTMRPGAALCTLGNTANVGTRAQLAELLGELNGSPAYRCQDTAEGYRCEFPGRFTPATFYVASDSVVETRSQVGATTLDRIPALPVLGALAVTAPRLGHWHPAPSEPAAVLDESPR